MIDLEKSLAPLIAERCKKLREEYNFSMEKVSDKSSVSRIEKAAIPKSGNFITETVLFDYTNAFGKSSEEIIFGNTKEFEQTLLLIFEQSFRLIRLKNLATDSYLYNNIDNFDIELQKSSLSMAEAFAEFDLMRYNFLKSNEIFMDVVSKEFDRQMLLNGKFINIERDFRTKPINENIVIDLYDMSDKLWLICREKFIRSFRAEISDGLFEDFKYSSINSKVNQWLIQQFKKIIVPDVVEKLKKNGVFKIGFMVKNLIDEFLDEDLSKSFQDTIPLQTTRDKHFKIYVNNFDGFESRKLSNQETEEKMKLIEKAFEIIQKSELPNSELNAKFLKHGIILREVPAVNFTKEVEIDELLNRAINTRGVGRTLEDIPMFEESPIFEASGFNSKEEIWEAMEQWHENKHFKNQNIPGYFTNNSQIIQRLQEKMNEEVHESIEKFIDIQNNLLKLLTDEELDKFAK
ncbi:hypothetical protein ACFVT8_16350 [Lysinibacillus sp. NPDC058147]|uniref:hypothetical protein n=1 Tax=unclassified Lysinibacillus TaxID=2636778 RepID=UPI0036DDBFD0